MTTAVKLRERHYGKSPDLIPCRICGKLYERVCHHAARAHGISSQDYKVKYDLPLSIGVIGKDIYNSTSTRSREALIARGGRISNQWRGGPTLHEGVLEKRVKTFKEGAAIKRIALSDEWGTKRDEIVRLLDEGKGYTDIERILGVSDTSIWRWLKLWGLDTRLDRHAVAKKNKDHLIKLSVVKSQRSSAKWHSEIARIQKLIDSGMGYAELASALNESYTTTRRNVMKLGLRPTAPKKSKLRKDGPRYPGGKLIYPNGPKSKTYCIEPGCERQSKGRGLCAKHYQRLMAKINGGWA